MPQLSDINWDLLKFKYEILGVGLPEIQAEYEISDSLMQYNSRNWHVVPASQRKSIKFTSIEDITSLTSDIAEQVRNEAEIISLVKQKFLFPKYVELEHILLTKAIAIANNMPEETTSAGTISLLQGVLYEMLRHNPIINMDTEESTVVAAQKVEVTVVNAKNTSATETTPVPDKKEAV